MARPYNFSDLNLTATDAADHSATLTLDGEGLYQNDLSISGLVPGGRVAVRLETQGTHMGTRRGARAYPTLTVTGVVRGSLSPFVKLCAGLTTDYVSTTDDTSDYPSTTLDATWTQGGETHEAVFEGAQLDTMDITDGESLTEPLSFTIVGPVTIDGETFIADW